MEDKLEISMNELMDVFKKSIISIVPILEKIKIGWKRGQSYDDWDNIVEALYKNIVCANLTGEVLENYSIPNYGFILQDYSNQDYIVVKNETYPNLNTAFISFESVDNVFDHARFAILDNLGIMKEVHIIQSIGLDFKFSKLYKGQRIIVESISVLL